LKHQEQAVDESDKGGPKMQEEMEEKKSR